MAQAAYIWWLITRLWTDEYPGYNEERVTYGYLVVGWLVAAAPIALGLPLGVAIAICDGYGEITEVPIRIALYVLVLVLDPFVLVALRSSTVKNT